MTTPKRIDLRAPTDPNRITFGIEIECLLPTAFFTAHDLYVGSYHSREVHLPAPFGRWALTHDGSLTTEHGYTACEIVSPVLTGLIGLQEVERIYAYLNGVGFKVNNSCGAHVHIGLKSILAERATDDDLRALCGASSTL